LKLKLVNGHWQYAAKVFDLYGQQIFEHNSPLFPQELLDNEGDSFETPMELD